MRTATHADRPHLTRSDLDMAELIRAQARVSTLVLGVGRLLFGGYFIYNGLSHFLNHQSVAAYAATRNIPSPDVAVALSGLLLLMGGLSIVSGQWPRIGAWFLVIFLAFATPTLHNFWAQEGPARAMELAQFTRNLALLGAAFLVMAIPWDAPVSERPAPSDEPLP